MRLLHFLRFALMPALFLHQAYVYDDKTLRGRVKVELYISDLRYEASAPADFLGWWQALWRASGNPVAKAKNED
jgi:hypothetical protein